MPMPPKCAKWARAQYSTVYPTWHMHVKEQHTEGDTHSMRSRWDIHMKGIQNPGRKAPFREGK